MTHTQRPQFQMTDFWFQNPMGLLVMFHPNDSPPSKAKAMAMVKAQDDGLKSSNGTRLGPISGEREPSFHGFDLVSLGVPHEALPIKGYDYKGRKGYTVYSAGGADPWISSWQRVPMFGEFVPHTVTLYMDSAQDI